MTFNEMRKAAGHSQADAAAYLWCSVRKIAYMDAGHQDMARMELYRLKLEKEGKL